MAINATNNGVKRELIPIGNYVARCYQMIHIGTVEETIQGKTKKLNKVRIGWELPNELKVFNPEKGEQPCTISKEFTLSMNEKANLRKMLASWRGKDFTEDEAKSFDITKLLGVPCMINVIHKKSSDGMKEFEEIAGVTMMPKGFECPPQINSNTVWEYDNPDYVLFETLPDFIKDKIKSSEEYANLTHPEQVITGFYNPTPEGVDDLPF